MSFVLPACSASKNSGGGSSTATPSERVEAIDATTASIDTVLAKYYEARGGLEKIRSIQSLVQAGEVEVQGVTLFQIVYIQRPGKYLEVIEIPSIGRELMSGYDGERGWRSSSGPRGKPEEVSDLEAQKYAVAADLDGVLVDYAEKGYTITYQGQERVRGHLAHKLLVEPAKGTPITVYLDSETYLKRMQKGEALYAKAVVIEETHMSDYRSVDGLMVPYQVEVMVHGETVSLFTVSDVRLNEELAPHLFTFPEDRSDEK